MQTAVAQVVLLTTQIASVVVLSRLLAPADFGLMAMVVPLLALVGLVQDFGLLQATVQRRGITQDEVSFLFWVNMGASVALAVMLAGLATLVGSFYADARVGPLVVALAFIVVISGASAQPGAILQRRLRFGRVAAISATGAVAALVTAVLFALVRPDHWALFAGMVAGTLIPAVLTWLSAGWLPSRPRYIPVWRKLLGFGAGVTGFNIANFVTHNADNILIGRAWGGVELGLYDRAYKLLLFPLNQVSNPLARVMIPGLSRLVAEPHRYRSAFLRVQRLVLIVALPGIAAAIAHADRLVPLALGQQWLASAPIFQALGFAGLLQMVNSPAGWLFISQGRSGDYLVWGLAMAAISVGAMLAGLPYGGLGVAAALSVAQYVKTPVLWFWLCRKGPVAVGDVVRSVGPLLVGSHAALGVIWLTRDMVPGGDVAVIAGGTVLSYAVTAVMILPFPSGRATLREAAGLLAGLSLPRRAAHQPE
jgi:PST family polysaccharide transporter